MDYALLALAALMLAVDFAINKLYQRKAGTGLLKGLKFNALHGLCSTVVFLVATGFRIRFSLFSVLMASAFSLLVMTYNIIGFRIMKNGSIAIYTLFLMTGGMLVPYVWGIAFLDEKILPLRIIGVVLIVCAVALSNLGAKKLSLWQILMCVAVFFINGSTSVISKLHQIETVLPTVDAMNFVVLTGMTRAVIAGVLYFAVRLRGEREDTVARGGAGAWLLIVASAAVAGFSYFLQLLGAANLPATVLYPILTGGTMVLSALAGVIFFKDKLTKSTLVALVLCLVGTLLFL